MIITGILISLLGIVWAFDDALHHFYANVKRVLHIPDKWDWWFNPAISWKNKYRNKLWQFFTPISDQKHVNRTIQWLLVMGIVYNYTQNIWISLGIGILGVYIMFNLIYKILKGQ